MNIFYRPWNGTFLWERAVRRWFRSRSMELSGKYEMYIKDESRNPTWSHKDRLNFAVVSAALKVSASGVVSASFRETTADHLRLIQPAPDCPGVILTTTRPPTMASFLASIWTGRCGRPGCIHTLDFNGTTG